MTDTSICSAAGTFYRAPNRLCLFEQINLAKCASERAKVYVTDTDRFESEYVTAAHWATKRVILGW